MERRTFALLLGGNKPVFTEQTLEWRDYLIDEDEAGFDPARVRVYCNPFWNIEVLDQTDDFFDYVRAEDPRQDVVVIYNGHGLEGSFCPSSGNYPIRYEELAVRINHQGGTLFVNDTCYAGSAIPVFRRHGLIPRGSVLASCKGNEKGSTRRTYHRALLAAWRDHKPYRGREIESELVEEIVINPDGDDNKSRASTRIIEVTTKRVQHPRLMGACLDHLLFPR